MSDKLGEELNKAKEEIVNEIRASLTRTNIQAILKESLPKDHDKQHEELRRFLEHSPDAKKHGDHHDFTESVRNKINEMVVAIFKGFGGIIIIAILVGLWSWAQHQAGQ